MHILKQEYQEQWWFTSEGRWNVELHILKSGDISGESRVCDDDQSIA